jgi:hypothetical protein
MKTEDNEFDNLYTDDGDLNFPLIIQKQLYETGRMKVWSWGAHDFVGDQKERSLTFHVNGHLFQGTVKIRLNSLDLYNISFIKDSAVLKELKDIYFDCMTDLIDVEVERIPEYKR